MSQDKSEPKKRQVGYLVYPFEIEDLATAEQVLSTLERLHYLSYTPVIASIYLKSTNFWTWDRQISYALIEKCDVLLLVHEEHMTPLMLHELMRGKALGKPVVRIQRKAD